MELEALLERLRKIRFLSEFLTYDSLQQITRYVIIGFTTVGTEFLILYILKEYAGIWYIYANSAAYIVSFWLNFLLNKFWAFKSRGKFRKQLLMNLFLFCFNLAATNYAMYFFTDILNLYYIFSKVISVGMVVSWNFVLYKKVIYK